MPASTSSLSRTNASCAPSSGLEDANAGVEQALVVEPLGGAAGPVVRIGRERRAGRRLRGAPPPRSAGSSPVGHVRVDDVERLPSPSISWAIAVVIGR